MWYRLCKNFDLLPSAWLLILQFSILILSLIMPEGSSYRVVMWALGVLVLLLIARVIRQTPMFTVLGLSFVAGALLGSIALMYWSNHIWLQAITHCFEAAAYFSAAYGLVSYMFHDRYLTMDELFAAGAVFTLLAWGFAFLYQVCLIFNPASFYSTAGADTVHWLDLLFLSFSLQSATGLSELMPRSAAVRVIAMLQMFGGVMYLALVVSRLVALHYIRHKEEGR